jgi:hypothetical protein
MSQIDSGFSESQKDSLSWALIAKLLVEIEESVVPTELFPSSFFAQSFELEPFNRESLVSIRRRANGVIAGSTELPDIFERIQQDAQEAASYILSESDISVTNEPSKQALAGAEIAKQFSKLLNQDSYKIEWGWADASDGMGGEFAPKEYLLQHFEIPSAWNAFAPPLKDTDWMAWLWFVMKDGQPHSVSNFKTGEALLAKGKNGDSISVTSGKNLTAIPSEVQDQLGFYVYALRDPRNKEIFYVGKGIKDRILQHQIESDETPESQSLKLKTIAEIRSEGLEVEHYFLRFGIESEAEAYAAEQAVIDALYLNGSGLTNLVKGHNSNSQGLARIDEIVERFGAPLAPAIDEAIILVMIPVLWDKDTTPEQLYQATRGHWYNVAQDARDKAKLVLGISSDIIRSAYWIDEWKPSTGPGMEKRWEFDGRVATEYQPLIGTRIPNAFNKSSNPYTKRFLGGYKPEVAG